MKSLQKRSCCPTARRSYGGGLRTGPAPCPGHGSGCCSSATRCRTCSCAPTCSAAAIDCSTTPTSARLASLGFRRWLRTCRLARTSATSAISNTFAATSALAPAAVSTPGSTCAGSSRSTPTMPRSSRSYCPGAPAPCSAGPPRCLARLRSVGKSRYVRAISLRRSRCAITSASGSTTSAPALPPWSGHPRSRGSSTSTSASTRSATEAPPPFLLLRSWPT